MLIILESIVPSRYCIFIKELLEINYPHSKLRGVSACSTELLG